MPREYDTLAEVYDWLVPDALVAPEESAAAFASVVDGLAPGARVLDCACGMGQLAVGLALRGFESVATDASGGMIERTRRLAREHRAALQALTCAWEELPQQRWSARFDAVFCVGNSLAHAAGRSARRAALAAMAAVLGEGGTLVVTSRNWELVRRERPGLQVTDRLVVRGGVAGLVVYAWTIPEAWDEPHAYDIAVALLGDGGEVATHREHLPFAPFTHEELDEDLRAADLQPASSTYEPDTERYLVTAVRRRQ